MVVAVVIGILCVGLGLLLLYLKRSGDAKRLELRSTQTSRASELHELASAVSAEIGPGAFNQFAEVKGNVVSDKPLRSELSECDCIWYSMNVQELYEETYTETDSNGNVQQRTRTGSSTVASNTRSIPFEVSDDSGRIMVDPSGATIEGDTVLDRHEQAPPQGNRISFGRFSLNLTSSGGRRITGYRYTEQAIPIGARVYVVGEACDRDGTILCIREPQEEGKPFMISVRSEEEIVKGLETSSTLKKWIGIGLIVVGTGVVIAGVAGAF